jgi:hypothetical protein
VRNVIEPGRDLGHVDRSLKKDEVKSSVGEREQLGEGVGGGATTTETGKEGRSEDCKEC